MARSKEDLITPPKLAAMLLGLSCADRIRNAILGDLQEGFHARIKHGLSQARHWYWAQCMASAAPLMKRRIQGSALGAVALVMATSVLAILVVNAWDVAVSRNVAQTFLASVRGSSMRQARALYILVQAISVAFSTVIVGLITFRPEHGILRNASGRLTVFALLILVPPFAAHFFQPHGYPLSFLLPWAVVTMVAMILGALMAMRLVRRRS